VSGQNFDVVRAAWDAFSRHDVDDFLDHVHPDVEIVPFGAAMEGEAYRGHAGVRDWWEHEIDANWETFDPHAEDFEEVGDRLVVIGHWIARGRTSGVDLNMPATWVVDIKDGKIARWQTFTDRDDALRAART